MKTYRFLSHLVSLTNNPFKTLLNTFLIFLLGSTFIIAQETSPPVIPLSMLEENFNSLASTGGPHYVIQTPQVDTFFQTRKPKLLPDNMSFVERGLWGENGLLRKIGLVPELTREQRKVELGIRRTMLTAHQIGGFTTLGLMLTTVYLGQKVIDGRRDLGQLHKGFAEATIATYTLTGLLAVLSPPPLIRRNETSTTSIHKTLAWIHVAGMILTPILATYIGSHRRFNMDKARVHQVAGYITTAVFAASLIVITI